MKRRGPEYRSIKRRFKTWLARNKGEEITRWFEGLSLRRDTVTLIEYVRDNKVVGIQGTGNMPLKAVREVTARFVDPPALEKTIGDYTHRIRSETELWALHFPRIMAEVGGLLAVAPARRWRLTAKGAKFLDAGPLPQVASLLEVWWWKINWLITYPYEGMGDGPPPFFNRMTLEHLLALPVGEKVLFKDFADELIDKAGLTWTAKNNSMDRICLRGSIAHMVVHIIAAFGLAERGYMEERTGATTTRKLNTLEITQFGRALLEAMTIMGGG